MRKIIIRVVLTLLGWVGIRDYVMGKLGADDTVKTGETIVYVLKKEK